MYKRFAAAALAVSITSAAMAQDATTSAEFLKFSPEGQRGFIVATINGAGLVAAQNNKQQTACINDWAGAQQKTDYKPVFDTMAKHPAAHPSAVIVALLQKACGSFKYATALAGP